MSPLDVVEVLYPILRPRLRDSHAPLKFAWKVFASLSTFVPDMHGNSAWQVRILQHALLIRCPREAIGHVMPASQGARAQGVGALAAQRARLAVGEHGWWLGDPQVRELTPSPILQAQLIYMVKSDAPALLPDGRKGRGKQSALLHGERWEATVRKRLSAMGIREEIPMRVGQAGRLSMGEIAPGKARVLRGHPVAIGGLTEEESLALQRHGLGGKQRMGCGVFVSPQEAAWS